MIEKPLATITEAEAIQYDRQVTFTLHFMFTQLGPSEVFLLDIDALIV